MKVTEQDVRDWKNNPITKNYEQGVHDIIAHYKEQLGNPAIDMPEIVSARKKGIMQGLEALLTYEPELTEDGEFVEYDEV